MKKILSSIVLLGALSVTGCGLKVNSISKEAWTNKVAAIEKQNYKTANFKFERTIVTTVKDGEKDAKSDVSTEKYEATYTYNEDTQTWSSEKAGSEDYVSTIGSRASSYASGITILENNEFTVCYFDDLSVVISGKGKAELGQIADADESFLFSFNKNAYLTSQLSTEVSVSKEETVTTTVVDTTSVTLSYSL